MDGCTFAPNLEKSKRIFHKSRALTAEHRERPRLTEPPAAAARSEDELRQRKRIARPLPGAPFSRTSLRASAPCGCAPARAAPTNTRRRSVVQRELRADRQRRASAIFYERQMRARSEHNYQAHSRVPRQGVADESERYAGEVPLAPTTVGLSSVPLPPAPCGSAGQRPRAPPAAHVRPAPCAQEKNARLENSLRNPHSFSGHTNPNSPPPTLSTLDSEATPLSAPDVKGRLPQPGSAATRGPRYCVPLHGRPGGGYLLDSFGAGARKVLGW